MILRRFRAGLALTMVLLQPALGAQRKPIVIGSTGQQQQIQAADTLLVPAATTANASLNVPQGTAPTSPVNGDIWLTTAGMYARVNGSTVGPFGSGGSGTVTSVICGTGLSGGTITTTGTCSITAPVTVALGGTNATSASGTALDNISGFASTGFLTRTGAGAYSFQSLANGITLGNIAQIAANTVIGNATASTANAVAQSMPSCSAASSALTWTTSSGFGCNTISGGSGTVTTTGSPATGNLAKFSGSTSITNATVSAFLDSEFSSTQGAVLYRGASGWSALAPGTSGNVLSTRGAAADPIWTSPVTVVSSGGGGFAFPFVQDALLSSTTNVTSYTATFPQTAAASGNTVFMIVATDSSQTVNAPAGWTVDVNKTQASFARIMVLHKATASDTSATFTTASVTSYAVMFFEIAGTHTLDTHADSGVANTQTVTPPSITPSAGAMVFSFACEVANSAGGSGVGAAATVSPVWNTVSAVGTSPNQRILLGHVYAGASNGAAIQPPTINNQGQALFSGGGIAISTFSIL